MLQMYTTWLDALEQGDMTGVCIFYMTLTFDVLDINLLLEKLKLYGLDRNALQWLWSYLPLEAGVSQGSILGPVLCTIFTNELPQVVHEDSFPVQEVEGGSLFSIQCQECGGVCCYADDSTYSVQEMILLSCQRS